MDIQGLIVGLGNPGPQYDKTRHNIGFMTLDALFTRLAQDAPAYSTLQTPQSIAGSKYKCELWKAQYNGGIWLFAKPQTFMNLSGESVSPLARFYRIPPEAILVIHDELDLPLGRMRAKFGGGTAGHRGLNSIVNQLGTKDFNRLRIGIGKPEKEEILHWVLSRFPASEQTRVKQILQAAVEATLTYMKDGIKEAARKAAALQLDETPDHSDKISI